MHYTVVSTKFHRAKHAKRPVQGNYSFKIFKWLFVCFENLLLFNLQCVLLQNETPQKCCLQSL